jgi:hypothetical protein
MRISSVSQLARRGAAAYFSIAWLFSLAACDSFEAGFITANGAPHGVTRSIDDAYAARDACLAKNVSAVARQGMSVNSSAHAVALTCSAETEKLIAVSKGDENGAAAIRADSELRARALVSRSQN